MSDARFQPSGPLRGRYEPPADKSISHRAALFGAMSDEPVAITNYLDAADTQSTLDAVLRLGAGVEDEGDGRVLIRGVGLHAPLETTGGRLDVGNSGTLLRLLPGWLAGQPGGEWVLDGDESIRRRPVDRIVAPLRRMGARIDARDDRLPPLTVHGGELHGTRYELPMASAQVKSCVLIAGMLADGSTTIVENRVSRDHTERILARSRVPFERDGLEITVAQVDELELDAIAVILGDLEEPGEFNAYEPVGELDVAHGPLVGTEVAPDEVPAAIDELTLVALLGAFAEGDTIVRGAGELRHKESDRIAAVVDGLAALGADIEATGDGFAVHGTGDPLRGGVIDARGDHRIAMLGAIAGLASRDGVEVLGMDSAAISYPGFRSDLGTLLGG